MAIQIFSDTGITLEDILSKKGEVLQKGAIDDNGDVEFWPEKKGEEKL